MKNKLKQAWVKNNISPLPEPKFWQAYIIIGFMVLCIVGAVGTAWVGIKNIKETPALPVESDLRELPEVANRVIIYKGASDYRKNEVIDQIITVASEENFEQVGLLIRLAEGESQFNPNAIGDGFYRSRGIFQISEFYWPEVSDECAFNVDCSTRWTINKLKEGQGCLWSVYKDMFPNQCK